MTRDEMEQRRQAAIPLLAILRGRPYPCLARRIGVSRTTIARWRRQLALGGTLEIRKATGRPCRLSAPQLAILRGILPARKWTTREFAREIQERFGVAYDIDHTGRIMHGLGWVSGRKRPAPAPWEKEVKVS